MFAVVAGSMDNIETSAFKAINGLPDWLQGPMWLFQIFGSLAFVGAVALISFVIGRYRLGSALLAAIPLKLAFEWWVVKALVERKRPSLTVADAIVREASSSPLGFPSGHAIFAFVLAGLLAPYLGRRATVLVYLLAILNSVGRIYLGAHNPLDVVAGAGLGLAIAASLNLGLGIPREGMNRGSSSADAETASPA